MDGLEGTRKMVDRYIHENNMSDICHAIWLQRKNADFFRQYVTEDFSAYLHRKLTDQCHGNHIEMQALSELYNRPIEVYQYSTGEWLMPINTGRTLSIKALCRISMKFVDTGFTGCLENLENLEFCHLRFQAWKMPGICSKTEKPGILTQNLGEKIVLCKFCFSRFTFQDVIFKKILIYICHICIINTNTDSKPNWPGISLHLPGIYQVFLSKTRQNVSLIHIEYHFMCIEISNHLK